MSALHRLLWSALPSAFLLGLPSVLHAADIGAAVTGTSTNGFRPLVTADRTSQPLLAPASREGEIRLKQFKHDPALKVDLWAAEPMLANPVAFSVDEKGRVFTAETYRYRSSVLDIRHYMFMLEDDLASRSLEDRLANIRKWFGPDGERALSTETEVIRLVEDTNGDGVADKSTVYAEGFTSPLSGIASGVLARHGEVWVTEIPSLWKFRSATAAERDSLKGPGESLTINRVGGNRENALSSHPHTPDRGVVAEELLTGFGIRFSFTGHDLHGLKLGPDGRLYFSCGDRGAHVVTREGTVIDLPDEGAVFRCEPDGSNLEVVHRGLRNPQELAFNEYGDLFSGDNDSDQGDRERWVQIIEGADSGWRVGYQHAPLGNAGPWNMERLWVPHFEGQAAYLLPPIANIGDGPSGLVYDATHRYGKQEAVRRGAPRDTFLLAYFKGTSAKSGVYALGLVPQGAGYALTGHDEFLWNSLVPDVDLAPDGSVFFADWHEGWPKSNKGRLYRAYLPDVIASPVLKQTAKLLGEGMTNRSEKMLLDLLGFPDMRVRQEAQFELAARGMKSFPELREAAADSRSPFARIHALWGIGQLARSAPRSEMVEELESLLPITRDPDVRVREAGIRMLGAARVLRLTRELDRLMTDPNPRIRVAALMASRDLRNGMWHPDPKRRFYRYSKTVADKVGDATEEVLGRRLTEGPGGDSGHNAAVHELLEEGAGDVVTRTALALWFASAFPSEPRVDGQLRSQGWPEMRHGSADVRMVFLLAERHRRDSNIAQFLSDADPLLVLEAARAINDLPITNALPALAALAEPAKLNSLLQQFASLRPENLKLKTENLHGAIRDVRADQPLPWGDAPVDQLTPMLLRIVNANVRTGTPESAARLAALAARGDLPVLIRTEALNGLANWARPFPRDRIVGVYRPLPPRDPAPARDALKASLPAIAVFQGPPPLTPEQQAAVERARASDPGFQLLDTRYTTDVPAQVLSATAEAVLKLAPPEGADFLFRVVASQAPAPARTTALRCLAELATEGFSLAARFNFEGGRVDVDLPGGSPVQKSNLRKLGSALQLAAEASDEPLRLEGSRIRAVLNPADAAGQIAGKLTGGSIAEQQAAYATLGDLKSDAADALLVESLDRLMKREVANEVMLDLVQAAGKRDAAAVKSRLAAYQDWKLPKDHLSPYRETLNGGDASRGRKIFYEHAAVACTRCHQIGGDGGGNAGPKLDGVASRTTREYLLESVVAPNQQVVQGFESAVITLTDGQTYAGVVKSENDSELVVISPEEGDVVLKKSRIQTREKGLSGMPDGLGALLTPFELRDVIEFLGTLK